MKLTKLIPTTAKSLRACLVAVLLHKIHKHWFIATAAIFLAISAMCVNAWFFVLI